MRSRLHVLAFITVLAVLPGLTMSSSLAVHTEIRSAESLSSPNLALPPLVDIPAFRSDPLGGSIDPVPGPESEPVIAWHTPYGASNVWPLLVSDLVIGGSNDGALVALDARTGEQKWRFAPSEGVTRSIGAAGGSVFVDAPAHVYALDVTTGSQLWQADAAKPVRGVVVDGVFYVPPLGGAVGFDAR